MSGAKQASEQKLDAAELQTEQQAQYVERMPKLLLILLVCLVIAIVVYALLSGVREFAAWGQVGDYLGGIMNPIVAGCALFALALSVRIQRAELKETRDVLAEQSKTAESQRSEQRFFDLMRVYQDTVTAMYVDDAATQPPVTYRAKTVLNALTSVFTAVTPVSRTSQNQIPHLAGRIGRGDGEGQVLMVAALAPWSYMLDHYFRVVYSILREAEETLKGSHWRYAKLFRAQLSADELTLLACDLLRRDPVDAKNRVAIVAKYGLLKHMAEGPLRRYAESILPKEVFGRKYVGRTDAATIALQTSAGPGTQGATA